MFGGVNKNTSRIADTVAVRFGEYFSVLHLSIECFICYIKDDDNNFLLFRSWC